MGWFPFKNAYDNLPGRFHQGGPGLDLSRRYVHSTFSYPPCALNCISAAANATECGMPDGFCPLLRACKCAHVGSTSQTSYAPGPTPTSSSRPHPASRSKAKMGGVVLVHAIFTFTPILIPYSRAPRSFASILVSPGYFLRILAALPSSPSSLFALAPLRVRTQGIDAQLRRYYYRHGWVRSSILFPLAPVSMSHLILSRSSFSKR
jgi:hypothetical protein